MSPKTSPASPLSKPRSVKLLILALTLLLLTAIAASMTAGQMKISPFKIIRNFFSIFSEKQEVFTPGEQSVLKLRVYRTAAAALAGIALSIAGVIYQSIFINPLVSPDLLGVTAGSSFGAAVGILISGSFMTVQTSAFLFGLAAVFFAVTLAKQFKGDRLIMLMMSGMISSSLFGSLLSLSNWLAKSHELSSILHFMMGGLATVQPQTVAYAAFLILLGSIFLFLMANHVNLLSLGEETASSLGINATFSRTVLIMGATLISSAAVYLGGAISWVGMMIPHMARMLAGSDNRKLIPVAALIGGSYLIAADIIARSFTAGELPLNLITSAFGIPFLIFVLFKTTNREQA